MPPRPRTSGPGARLAALTLVAAMAVGAGPALAQSGPPIYGTRGPDVLTGTPDGEYIDGRQGDDVIDGAGGPDTIVAGPGADTVVAYTGAQVEAVDGEVDTVRCIGGGVTVLADADDVLDPGCIAVVTRSPRGPAGPSVPAADPRLAAPARTDRPLHIVYEFAANARILHDGYPGVSGLSTQPGSHRQHPLGDPFPATRWIGKVNHREMTGRSAAQIAALLRSRMNTSSIGGADPQGSLVGVDEVGRELQDDGLGPRFLAAMRILSRQRHPVTREPLSRRVVLYVAPKMVSNIGARNDREDWDSTMAAARLAGAVYLQMFHATAGRVTGPATAQEWRDYPAVWRSELGPSAGRLRFLFSGVGAQDVQWRNAASTEAGRRTLRSGAGAYRLNSAANARAWLRNWNRYVVGRRAQAPSAPRR